MVAFKRLDRRYGQGNFEFWKEIMMLSRYTHGNLISLLGFCDEDGEKILVYEHASNGSLDLHLSSTTLTWSQRLKICLDAARGLNYLHDDKGTQQRVLHRDIKSSNILLDERWNAKVSDMGLSKIGPANQLHTALVTNVVGTLGYLDPMYMELGILTKESDVYSFGVVLFEVLCGRLCFENSNGGFMSLVRMWKQKYKLKKLDEIIFQHLVQEMDPRSVETFSDIAFQCLKKHHDERPIMSAVVEKLETALDFQEFYEEMKHPLSYEMITKATKYPLTYKSEEELNSLLAKGVILKGPPETLFSLNKNGEHCEMILAIDCIVSTQRGGNTYIISEKISRHSLHICCQSDGGIFKAHVRTRFLSPNITYAVNLVFKFLAGGQAPIKPFYAPIRYRLEGETNSLVSWLVDVREDGWYMAELYQFESQRRNVDLEILFEGIMDDYHDSLIIEGIEFLPIEKGHEVYDKGDMQTISESDDTYWEKRLPNNYEDITKWSKDDVKWTTKKELYSLLCKGFLMSNGHGWFSVAKNGKTCVMLPARAALLQEQWKWNDEPESRFGEVAFDPIRCFDVVCKIESQILSPETTYACYLVYRLLEKTNFESPLEVTNTMFKNLSYIYLLDSQTPVIRQKVDQNSRNPLNRPKLKGIPRQREDGWMEVQVYEFQPSTSSIELLLVRRDLHYTFPRSRSLEGLIVQGVEFRPV